MASNIPCGCIKNYFNLDVSFTDCNHILIQDQSEWMQGEGYTTPSSFDVTMTVEKWGASITKSISPSASTTFSTSDFGLSCFGDDILCITVESCGVKYTRKKAMVCGIECKIHALLANAETSEEYEVANKLMMKLGSLKINIEFERYDIATDLLEAIKKQLKILTVELTVDVNNGVSKPCGCQKTNKCGTKCECSSFCGDISIEKVRNVLYSCKEYISKYGEYVVGVNNYGYSDINICPKKVGKVWSYSIILEKYYVSLLRNSKSCLCGSEINSLIQKALKVLPLSCQSKSSIDYVTADKTKLSSWISRNPNCVSFEKWERAMYTFDYKFDISVNSQPFEVAFYVESSGIKLDCDDIVATFSAIRDVSCELAYSFSVNKQPDCVVELSSKVLDDCLLEYSFLVKELDNCKIDFNTYAKFISCGIKENVVANLIKCNIDVDIKDDGIDFILDSGKTINAEISMLKS